MSGQVIRDIVIPVVEKIARVLLHCYGIKPELSYEQTEALNLLRAVTKEN